jgi:DSF synthase
MQSPPHPFPTRHATHPHDRAAPLRAAGPPFAEMHCAVRDGHSLWVELRPSGRPCISARLLAELNTLPALVARYREAGTPLGHVVLHSRRPGVFSLGGDLALFRELIQARDEAGLLAYAQACVEIVYQAGTGYGDALLTYALVQGEALGGGMETALTADCVVLEEQARMGLPEVLFNLFPGMGAPTFLRRKLAGGRFAVEDLIRSGRLLSADELLDLGLCQHVAPTGEGEALVRDLIREAERSRNARQAVRRAREIVAPLDRAELTAIVEVWVDMALRLSDRDLRLMDRLVQRQQSK